MPAQLSGEPLTGLVGVPRSGLGPTRPKPAEDRDKTTDDMVRQAEEWERMQKQADKDGPQRRPQSMGPGFERVVGHPWVTGLKSVAEWQWSLPAPGALDEHLVFLLIGGSNIVGSPGCEPPNVFKTPLPGPAWSCDPTGRFSKRCCEPLHPHDGHHQGVGPCRAFARRVLRNLPKLCTGGAGVFLVPAAVGHGDMTMNSWDPDGVLYAVAVARARTSAEAVGGRVAGVLWHAGEADACTQSDAEKLGERLERMISNLRTDLDCPNLPFICGEIGDSFLRGCQAMPDAYLHAREVNRQLRKIGELPWTKCIRAPTTHCGDRLHFDAPGMEEFGTKAAEEWERMFKEVQRRERRVGPDGVAHKKNCWVNTYGGLMALNRVWASAPSIMYDENDDTTDPIQITTDLPPDLVAGLKVEAFGLVGAKELNGQVGVIVEERGDGRVVVNMGQQNKALRRDNLRLVPLKPLPRLRRAAPRPAAPAAAAPSTAAAAAAADEKVEHDPSLPDHLQRGASVVAHGLVGAKELNGLNGKVIGIRADGRVVIDFERVGNKALKKENLKPPPRAGPVRPSPPPEDAGPQPPTNLPFAVGAQVEVSRSNGSWSPASIYKLKHRDGHWMYVVSLDAEANTYKHIDVDKADSRIRPRKKPVPAFEREQKGEDAAGNGGKDRRRRGSDDGDRRKRPRTE
eukprot:TRINITY_DN1028_c2_g2_i1.p1 TRINITY_DN1028_c2_g2~~TRINITY_DN1028_c2_g2_i1.p1  ORF type:complete len:682 (+),score=169.25 TRINITY_DN1028_c2_g2_i1:53-2098(+)